MLRVPDGPQQRPLHQEALVVELADVAPLRLGHAHVQQLLRVVPLVQRLRGVEPLVALQADQLAPEHVGERLRDLRLPHARLALERERAPQHERQVQRREEPLVGVVPALGQEPPELSDGRCAHSASSPRRIFSGVNGIDSSRTPQAS